MKKIILILISCLLTLLLVAQPSDKFLILDMVHHNPGEPLTKTEFRKPEKLKEYNYNGMVTNEFKFPQCALTFSKVDKRIFPKGSQERQWTDELKKEIWAQIRECHQNGLESFYFMDIIVLPKKLVELYKDEICDENGKISFSKPKTWEIHKMMLNELFNTFPDMDGLVIRTGETYTHSIPHHMGNGPVDYQNKYNESIETHAKLMQLLRDEVCVKRGKKVVYRTWDFGFFHIQPEYYLTVTNQVEPHPNLYLAIKHTNGDYFRTFPFNKTLTLGKHKQVVEVQCQREYEGKGAFTNYVANAVINGFEETKGDQLRGLNDIKDDQLFSGVWTWSRGGGWFGPFLKNEFWCDMNAYVVSQWANNPNRAEEEIFKEYASKVGISVASYPYFRKMCLLSPDAIIRGRGSLIHPVNVVWTRDHYLAGESQLSWIFDDIIKENLIEESLYEMKVSVAIWKDILDYSEKIECENKETEQYLRTSAKYGYLLHRVMEQGWIVMLKGYAGDKTGAYDKLSIALAIEKYDQYWKEYQALTGSNPDSASLYYDQYLEWDKDDYHVIHMVDGMGAMVDRYRKL